MFASLNNTTMTIEKGTSDYQQATSLANELQRVAAYDKWNNSILKDIAYEPFFNFIEEVEKVNGFASQVAATIKSKMSAFNNQIAYVSPKQAWVLACAAIENNIKFNF